MAQIPLMKPLSITQEVAREDLEVLEVANEVVAVEAGHRLRVVLKSENQTLLL